LAATIGHWRFILEKQLPDNGSSGDYFDEFITSLRPFANGCLTGQNDSIKLNPSLAVFRGLKRAGIDFATSVPCVNLQVQWIVSTDDESADEVAEERNYHCRDLLSPGTRPPYSRSAFIFNLFEMARMERISEKPQLHLSKERSTALAGRGLERRPRPSAGGQQGRLAAPRKNVRMRSLQASDRACLQLNGF